MAQKRPGVMLYFDTSEPILAMPPQEAGLLFCAALRYARDGEAPDFSHDPMLALAWSYLKRDVERDERRYREICRINREKARERWDKAKQECSGMPAHADDANSKNNSKNKNKNNSSSNASSSTKAQKQPQSLSTALRCLPSGGGGAPLGREEEEARREALIRQLRQQPEDGGERAV